VKRGNAYGGQGIAVEPLGRERIHSTNRLVKDGNKTGLTTYPVNKEVLLKSRMRENLKSCSVRGLIAASGRRGL